MRIFAFLFLISVFVPAYCQDGLLECNFELKRNLTALSAGRQPIVVQQMNLSNIIPKAPASRAAAIDANGYWLPDSIVCPNSYKTVYEYDSAGRIIMFSQYGWDFDSECWTGNNKDVMKYDDNGNDLLYEWWTWDSDARDWYGVSRYEYEYDVNNRLVHSCQYEWDNVTAGWLPCYMHDFEYDIYGFTSLAVAYFWDAYASEWVGSQKVEYAYNNLGKPTLYVNYVWDSDLAAWIGDYKYVFEYDPYSGLSSFTCYAWSAGDWLAEACTRGVWNDEMTCWTLSEYYGTGSNEQLLEQTFYYFDYGSSELRSVAKAPQFALKGRQIQFQTGVAASVVDLGGRVVAENAKGIVQIPASGVFIIKIGEQSWKIAVK